MKIALVQNEMQPFFAANTLRVGWVLTLYALALFFVSDWPAANPFYFWICAGGILLSSLSLDFVEWTYRKLKAEERPRVWLQWSEALRLSLFFAAGMLTAGLFASAGVVHWAGFLSFAVWAAGLESIVADNFPSPRFAKLLLFAFSAPIAFAFIFIPGHEKYFVLGVAVFYHALLVKRLQALFNHFSAIGRIKESAERGRIEVDKFFSAFPAYISWLDGDLNYVRVNSKTAQVMGIPIDEFAGKPFGFSKSLDNSVRNFLKNFLESAEASVKFMTPIPIHEESRRHEVYLEKLQHDVAEKPQLIIMSLDVEDQLRAEENLQEEKVRQQQSARLASLGEMASGIAHEIKNPVAIISAANSLIQAEIKKELTAVRATNIGEKTQLIDKTLRRIVLIVEGMRKLARTENNGQDEWISITSLVQETLSFCEEALRFAGVAVEVVVPEYPIDISTQGAQISQVLLNLISNAKDIISQQEVKKLKIAVIHYPQGDVCLQVIDSGPGVKHPEKLFTPFFTTKDPGHGTGLGLSISKKIVEGHGGDLVYKREQDQTVFEIQIPKIKVRALALKKRA